MDPLVSLYYYAPVCAVMNGFVAVVMEMGTFKMDDVWMVGVFVLFLNAAVAFLLNVSSVFLVRAHFIILSLKRHADILRSAKPLA